jgi:hypothetical protein
MIVALATTYAASIVTFPAGWSQDAPCRMQYFVCACSAIAKDSFAQSIGPEWVQLSILAGVIVSLAP